MSFWNDALSRTLGVRVVKNTKLEKLERTKQELERLTLDREGELTAADLDGSGIGIVRHVDGFKMLLDPASLVDRAQLIHGGWER